MKNNEIRLLDDIELSVDSISKNVHELVGHPIYGHFLSTKNNQIAGLIRQICDDLIIIKQDVKFLRYKEGDK